MNTNKLDFFALMRTEVHRGALLRMFPTWPDLYSLSPRVPSTRRGAVIKHATVPWHSKGQPMVRFVNHCSGEIDTSRFIQDAPLSERA